MFSSPGLFELVRQVSRLLASINKTIAVAESCTGGLFSFYLTSVPGSSSYYLGGIIAYSPLVKQKNLNIPAEILRQHGPVSQETALAMAAGARRYFHADIGVGITGIAGPGGGSLEKPVGLVYSAIHLPKNKSCHSFRFTGSRHEIRNQACFETLRILAWKLSE